MYKFNRMEVDFETIDNITVDELSKEMPGYKLIGRTVEKVIYAGSDMYFKFTDGTKAFISGQFPISTYGRDALNKHLENSDIDLLCRHSDDW